MITTESTDVSDFEVKEVEPKKSKTNSIETKTIDALKNAATAVIFMNFFTIHCIHNGVDPTLKTSKVAIKLNNQTDITECREAITEFVLINADKFSGRIPSYSASNTGEKFPIFFINSRIKSQNIYMWSLSIRFQSLSSRSIIQEALHNYINNVNNKVLIKTSTNLKNTSKTHMV
ncbi:hypothetical protein ACTFIR_005746 [Dictyostelium discoideum]